MAKNTFDWNMIPSRLNSEQLKAYDKWAEETSLDVPLMIEELTGRDYKISVSWVDKSNSFVVSCTGKAEHPINPASTITSWSDDIADAMLMTLYKVAVLYEDGKWVDLGDVSQRG